MKLSRRVVAIVLIGIAILLVVWSTNERDRARRATDARTGSTASARRSLGERLLGPIASFAAALQWARVDDALRHGHPEVAYARAEFALELAPGDPAGWTFFAHHFIYDRASALAEGDRSVRAHWIQTGLDLLERAERECAEPGKIAFARAVVFLSFAQQDDADRAWPGTRREAWLEAARAFDRAALAGEPLAAEAARAARAEAAD
jgi:hypothetical protein